MGRAPEWYARVRASKYLGSIAPWEWDSAPVFWLEAVLTAESAENKAQQINDERAAKKANKGTRGQG